MKKLLFKFKKEKNISLEKREMIFDVLITICIVLMAIVISPKTLQNDTFYTIKCGEYVFQNGIFNLKSDPFSWLDLPYTFPHWLYDLIIFIIYSKAGWAGIYISTIVFTSLLGLLIYDSCLYKSQNRIVSSVIVLLTLYLMEPYIAARAQLVTFILFVLELLFIEKLLDTKKIKYGIGLIIIAFLIAQLHVAVFPMFFIFTAPFMTEYIFGFFMQHLGSFKSFIGESFLRYRKKFQKDEKKKIDIQEKINQISQKKKILDLKTKKIFDNPYKVKVVVNKSIYLLWIILIFSFMVGFLNPTGDTAYTYLYKTLQGNTTDSINEHQPVVLASSENFMVALVMFILLLTFMDLKIRLSDLFLLVGVIIMAFMSRRQIALFGIAGAPILARLVADFFEKYDKKTCEKLLLKATSVLGIVFIICFASFLGAHYYQDKSDDKYLYESDYPIKASDWILENLDLSTLKLYNEYNYGSYLIFRGIPVFIDSRADLYSPEFNNIEGYKNAGDDIFNDALDVPSLGVGYEKIFKKYGINHVILYDKAKLALLLDEDKNYNLIYDDDDFRIYERLNAEDGE